MDAIVEFAMPGVAAALVFYILVMTVPFRDTLLRHHAYVDVIFTFGLIYMLSGTYSGGMTAAIGGIVLSLMLWISQFLFLPIEEKTHDYAA